MKEPSEAFDPESGGPREGTYRRVLLVGFMASGKTTVGRALARLLNWEFVDFDAAVEERAGSTIPEIFRSAGEAHFRKLEAEIASDLLERTEVVLASGGGWPAFPGRMERLGSDTLSVWLMVSPDEALRRSAESGLERPLLAEGDLDEKVEKLLTERRKFYRRARVFVDTEAEDPECLALRIASLITERSTEPTI